MEQQAFTPFAAFEPVDALELFNHVARIDAPDEVIRGAVQEADLPALMATLAMITGDTALIATDLKPPSPAMVTTIAPQGGMSDEAQHKARRLAVDALIKLRDADQQFTRKPASALLDQCMRYLIRGDLEELRPLLEHELGIAQDLGAPDWTRQDLAPDTPFRVAVIGAVYEKLGFRLEATRRQAIYNRGAYRDVHVMGLLENELPDE